MVLPGKVPGIRSIEEPRSAANQVADRIREAIVSGALQPGSRLPETQLASQLGVSRIPVREALSRLEAEGLVKRVPYKGPVVVELTVQQVTESFVLRSLLEGFAAEAATPLLSDGDLAALRRLISELERRVEEGRFDELPELHRDFHFTIYSRCGYPKLISWIEELYHQFPKNLRGTFPARLKEPIAEYSRIVDALEARNGQLAGRLLKEHLLNGMEPTAQHYERLLAHKDGERAGPRGVSQRGK